MAMGGTGLLCDIGISFRVMHCTTLHRAACRKRSSNYNLDVNIIPEYRTKVRAMQVRSAESASSPIQANARR